jgi:predicted RNA-binding protein with PUA-like domain
MAQAYYLLKTEPSVFSFQDLLKKGQTVWDGVTNAAALITLRQIKSGDTCFIYHTGDEKAIIATASVSRSAYADPANPVLNDRKEPKFAVIDLVPEKPLPRPITLASIKADPRFADFALVKQSRLSVMPVPANLAKLFLSGKLS